MARIRTVKPELFRHEALFEAEKKTKLPLRLAFVGLFTACDREGRFKWKPRSLKLDVLPYDNIEFLHVLDALVANGFIVKYEFDGEEFGFIPSWSRHQVVNNRETESSIPSPEESTTCTRAPRVDDASGTPLVLAQAEGKGKEGKRKGKEQESAIITRPVFIPERLWNDWLIIRKKKNAPTVTETAWEVIVSESQKAGYSIEDALKECCLRNWVGFKAQWLESKKGQSGAAVESFRERDRRQAIERVKDFAPLAAARDDEIEIYDAGYELIFGKVTK